MTRNVYVISVAPQYSDRLGVNNYIRVIGDSRCWLSDKLSEEGLQNILKSSGIIGKAERLNVHWFMHLIEDKEIELETVFSELWNAFYAKYKAMICDDDVMCLNLMPYLIRKSTNDRLLRGFFKDGFLKSEINNRLKFAFFVQYKSIFKSDEFYDINEGGLFKYGASIIEFNGNSDLFIDGDRVEKMLVPREFFYELLGVDYDGVYKSLIYNTNNFIGHFKLPYSHVRTHYDLTDYICKDEVWEYFYSKIRELIDGHENILLFGAGFEKQAIERLCYKVARVHSDDLNIEVSSARNGISVQESGFDHWSLSEWSELFDLVLIVGDIINTGTSLSSIIDEFIEANVKGKEVRVFAFASMKNSVERISKNNLPVVSGIKIKREYFKSEESACILCELRQPSVDVHGISDFNYISEEQLTPFDFWELISECNALERDYVDVEGRKLIYGINTRKIFKNYRSWLKNLIQRRYQKEAGNSAPDAICVVDDSEAVRFAEIVCDALGCGYDLIVRVSRNAIKTFTSTKTIEFPISGVKYPIIVDSQIYTGKTIKALIMLCKTNGLEPGAIIVFSSLFDLYKKNVLENEVGHDIFISLYEMHLANNVIVYDTQ